MAARKKKRKSTRKKPLVPLKRKREVLGLILIVFAALLSLALVTYAPADRAIAQRFSLETALYPGQVRAHNALGHLGAALAYWLVPHFLGYPVLLLTVLIGVWGYLVLRHRAPVSLPLLSVLTVVGAFLLACFFGWLGYSLGVDLLHWSGEVGLGIAGWMRRLFGAVGSLILLLLMLTVTVLLVVDHDVQRSLDRLAAFFNTVRERVQAWVSRLKDQRATRKARLAKLREERRQSREATRQPSTTPEKKQATPAEAEMPSEAETSSATPPPSTPSAADGQRVNDLFRKETAEETSADAPPPPPSPKPEPKQPSTSPPAPRPSTPEREEPQLHVQEQIHEEEADTIDRAGYGPDRRTPYRPPAIDLLDETRADDATLDFNELEDNKQLLLDKLATYNVEIQDITAVVGPTVTRYELLPAPGIKISRIKSLEDDLAMALAAQSIRVIAPIPGKRAVGVEIPNRNRELVRLKSVIGTAKFRDAAMELPIAIGKTIEGEVFLRDLTEMPHLLIAGATGSGKSVGLNALITGLLYACHPANLKFVIIDPKKIELQQYAALEGHFMALPEDTEDPIITDFEQALGVFKSCEKEMERRYDLLADAGVRNIRAYNEKVATGALARNEGHEHMPYLVVVVDELADLMLTAGKEIEGPIARLAQMARAVGIHLVLATQRPSVDVITGLIKANFPSRIAYQVASRVDSRTILDQIGAHGLVGNGDLLYMSGSRITRLQGPFVSLDEVERVTEFVAEQPPRGIYWLPSLEDSGHGPQSVLGVEDTDEYFEDAARIVVHTQQGSVSMLQRKLSVGYTRAGRIVDQLEQAGIVGPFVGTKARDVLVSDLEELEQMLADEDDDEVTG